MEHEDVEHHHQLINIIDDADRVILNANGRARAAMHNANSQTYGNLDIRQLVIGNQCCTKHVNCYLAKHSVDEAVEIISE
jgi:hypothetical protein